ncbi:trans-aconitate methyltransferase 1 [Coemansia spiralis]|uniref:Trans-aconitate methyltransferase 1 n=2 Tax=Coemansia TaxID=4863 RepID=A0A9W8GF89_9FUNG|nr:S-adenosyl-L-methionine-dependent methyltransferase [Coemansia spiralis]KAJ1995868.1 trans-aconitate methyltransferase 1 [Coemansia umbellata]KAJ2625828.1 trans-aconitate methyltransferase 1 [Coemansia sp. RSA 1358]KAJ2680950.1 trans-aconitate methyltransferase 1 [Coemansia spiralis]
MSSTGTPVYEPGNYSANRPQYKPDLAAKIVAFHKTANPNAATDLAVDVATGTGIFARQLPQYFTRVIGTDISNAMLESARHSTGGGSVQYIQSPAESLSFLQDQTVDLITVATGAHWFDITKFLQEARRVLKPSGTLAIFGYTGFAKFTKYPQCDSVLRNYGLGDDMLGPYWEKGRDVLTDGYFKYHQELARTFWTGIQRQVYPEALEPNPTPIYPARVSLEPHVMDFKVTWRTLRQFLSTWSPLDIYQKKHPGDQKLCDSVIDDMMLISGVTDLDEEVALNWEQILVLAHSPNLALV